MNNSRYFNSVCSQEGKSWFENLIPKADIMLLGYGRTMYFQKDNILIEISIFNQSQKKLICQETFEGNDLIHSISKD